MISPHDILLLAPLALIGTIHRMLARNGSFLLVLSNLPITVMHELSHFIVALLLGGRPTGFSLWPRREGNRWRLGSVTARATMLSAAPTALAPLLWLFAAGLILLNRTHMAGESLPQLCGSYLAVYVCVAASIPSRQDLYVAITHPLSLMFWSALFAAAHFATGCPPLRFRHLLCVPLYPSRISTTPAMIRSADTRRILPKDSLRKRMPINTPMTMLTCRTGTA